MAPLVGVYQWLLESLLKDKPHLGRLRTHCRHCQIVFIADPRNAGREDLGCPFGCREAHRKRESTRRSVAYYSDSGGRKIKQELNQRRQRRTQREASEAEQSPGWEPQKASEARPELESAPGDENPTGSGTRPVRRWGEAMIEYVRLTSSLIEGRRIGRGEVVEMLAEVLRQHSIDRLGKLDQIVEHLNRTPP